MSESARKPFVIFIYTFLILATLLVYWQVHNFGFVNYDDNDYVYRNLHVTNGLSWDGVVWAFTTGHASNWHPLTWLSHMLDCRLFGTNPGLMHLASVLLHLVNAVLLFTILRRMTGALWQSAFVAAAFALHPMHVESVAWIAERKDVLSTFFLLLTLAAYAGYVKRPSTGRYLLTLTLFATGLMAKPMLVTLPLLLLLLDYWPLNRLGRQQVAEKIPFFILSAASSVITFIVQRGGGTVMDISTRPLKARVANVFLSYAEYIGKMLWPRDLAVHYPFNAVGSAMWQAVPCALLLLAISILAIRFGRNRRYLPVGWFWFLVMLVPVIGVVQVGEQAFADRYTYIPYVGLFMMAAWGLPDIFAKWSHRRLALGASAAIVLAAFGICAHRQVSYWNSSVTLFSHAIEVTRDNAVAHNQRGIAYIDLGQSAQAIEDLTEAIRIRPAYAEARANLGNAYSTLGRGAEAIEAFRQAIRIKPTGAEAYYNLANELALQGRCDEAADQYRAALQRSPDWPACMNNLAYLIAANPRVKGRDTSEAIRLAKGACEAANFRDATFMDTLAVAYASAGRFAEATDTAQIALNMATAKPQLRSEIMSHLSAFEHGAPWVDPTNQTPPQSDKP